MIKIAVAVYLLIISVVAVIMTVKDKKLAKNGGWRIPEKSLFIVSALGGSVAMYITMHKIRHKTKHKRFMIGIPLIMAVQVAVAAGLVFFCS